MPGPFRFAPPVLSRRALTRPRLLRPLLGRFTHRCTLVTAGAGHGKTTLLAQAVAENRFAPRGDDIWLAVESGDADATRLATDLLVALDAPNAPPTAAAVADAVWRRAPTEVCLVLDDVQHLPAGSPGSDLIAALLDLLPANGHLLIASRTAPPLSYARLAGQGAVLRIDELELRFDDDELTAFAAARDIPTPQLVRTAGWPAMAELVATAGADLVGDFLWEEVLEPLGAEQRHVLAVLSDLGGGDDQLLSAALDRPVQFDTTVPLISVDADGWYEPHALWHTVAGLELPETERVEIRRRAAPDLVARGRLDAAFTLLAGVELWGEAAPLFKVACHPGRRPAAALLRSWLARCPDVALLGPSGQLATGVLSALTAPELAAAPLRNAMAAFRDDGDVEGELSAISHLGNVAWWQRDLGVLAELSPRIGELAAAGNPTACGLEAIGRALVFNIMGDNAGLLAALDTIEPGVLDPRWEAVGGWLRGLALLGIGDDEGAFASFEAALPLADEAFRVTVSGTWSTSRWGYGDVEAIVPEAAALLAGAEATGIAQEIAFVAASDARACAHIGELDLARSYLLRAQKVAAHVAPAALVHIVLADAAIAIGEADDDRATVLLRAALVEHPIDGAAGSAWFTDTCMTYVLVPEQRSTLDAAGGSPRIVWARELAAVVAAGREGSARDRIATLGPVDPARVRGVLAAPFAADLAVALHDAGRVDDATALLAALGEPGRAHARRLGTPAAKALLAAVPAAPAVAVQIRAFGILRVDGLAIDRVRVRELLGYLLLHPVTTRAAVTALLWPDLDDRAAANNLRVTLSHLLRLLEPERTEGEAAYFVQQSASELRLVVDGALDVDVDGFDAALRAATLAEQHGSPSVALEHYLAATELYGGELLADLPDVAWADLERERGRTRFVAAAVRAGELLAASNDPDRAEQLARRALAVDAWSEPAYGVLASAALARGDRAAALRIIERCHEMLDELGVEVSDGTARLARRARAAVPTR